MEKKWEVESVVRKHGGVIDSDCFFGLLKAWLIDHYDELDKTFGYPGNSSINFISKHNESIAADKLKRKKKEILE